MKKLIIIFHFSFFIFHFSFGQQYGWVALNPASIPGTPDFSDLFFINADTGWISTSAANSVFYTADGAANFTLQVISSTIMALHMLDSNNGYAASNDGSIYRTTSGGTNWNYFAPTFATLNDITFPRTGSTATGYACGADGAIFSVTSSGATAMTSGVVSNINSITFPTDTEGWACGELIINFTGGSWQGDQTHPLIYYNAIYFVDPNNGWAVGDNGGIAHTTDGENWNAQTNPDPQSRSLYSVFFLNSNEGWTVGFNGIILHTTNGGTNWNIEGSGLTTEFLRGVQFTSSTNGYAVGNNKTLLKYTLISGTEEHGGGEAGKPGGVEVWPNPTRGQFKVQSANFKVELQSLELMDIYGKVPISYNNRTIEQLNNETIGFDISHLPAGIYFIRISLENQMIVKKVVKL